MVEINRAWVERLHAPRYIWSQIAALNPKRGILCREEKSQQQLLTWDVESGETHALMPPLDYQLNATLSQDGEFVTYLVPHPTHADVYQYVRVPFGGGEPQPIAQTALMNASPHIEEAAGRIGFTAVTGNGYIAQVWTPDGKKPLFSYESEVLAYGPALSFDGKIAVVATMQSPESESTHLEAYDIDTGAKISQLALPDTPLEAVKFAPGVGDTRLLVQAQVGLLTRPLVWDVVSGAVERVYGLKRFTSYIVWDWVDDKKLLISSRAGEVSHLLVYDREKKQIKLKLLELGTLLITYTNELDIIFHHENIHGTIVQSHVSHVTYNADKVIIFSSLDNKPYAFGANGSATFWRRYSSEIYTTSYIENTPRVLGVTFKDEAMSYGETAAWIEQGLIYINAALWDQPSNTPLSSYAVQAIQQANMNALGPQPMHPSLLTAHNMAAALALLTLHQSDPAIWAGGVFVRPILDWVHLYESVAPPEKAMMRLWFGGSPTEKPDAWRDASPLRQTKPLTVPVKILYHPYDSLTPIQHIQTYAANNPMVELIDISRDMVGPAHEQQEKLITRMLEAGLTLLQKGT